MTAESIATPSIWSRIAAALRGFGPTGALVFAAVIGTATFVETPIAALIVIVWAFASRTKFRELGLGKPKSWLAVIALGIALGLLEKFAMKAIVLPLLGAPAMNTAFAGLAENPRRMLFLVAYAIVGAGFCEELVFRGYLFERFGRAMGDGWAQRTLIVLITSAFFGALHYYPQGITGAENAGIGGLIAGTIYALNGKRLWLLVVMHATFDIAAFTMIYFGWENAVANAFFR